MMTRCVILAAVLSAPALLTVTAQAQPVPSETEIRQIFGPEDFDQNMKERTCTECERLWDVYDHAAQSHLIIEQKSAMEKGFKARPCGKHRIGVKRLERLSRITRQCTLPARQQQAVWPR
jgi:hypothetical protein